jgi:sulfonate transport system substrate-binding protein
MRTKLSRFGTFLAATLICGLAFGARAEPTKIRIAWVVVPASLAPLMLERKDVTKHLGVSYVLEPIHFEGTSPQLTALAAGELDIVTLNFASFGLAIQNAGMEDLRLIFDESEDGVDDYGTNEYMVLKNSSIQSIADLKGKVIATNAIGTAVDMAARAMLRRSKLEDKRDVTFIEAPFPTMKALLSDRRADLVSAVIPFSLDPALRDIGRTLFTQRDAMGATELSIWTVREDFITKNRAALVDFIEDALRSERWFLDSANHVAAIDILASVAKQPRERLDSWAFTKKDQYRDPQGRPNLAALQQNLRTQKDLGFLKIDIDVQKYADLALVSEAAQRLK